MSAKVISTLIPSHDKQVRGLFFSKYIDVSTQDKRRVWVKINKQAKQCTIHANPDCSYVKKDNHSIKKSVNQKKIVAG